MLDMVHMFMVLNHDVGCGYGAHVYGAQPWCWIWCTCLWYSTMMLDMVHMFMVLNHDVGCGYGAHVYGAQPWCWVWWYSLMMLDVDMVHMSMVLNHDAMYGAIHPWCSMWIWCTCLWYSLTMLGRVHMFMVLTHDVGRVHMSMVLTHDVGYGAVPCLFIEKSTHAATWSVIAGHITIRKASCLNVRNERVK